LTSPQKRGILPGGNSAGHLGNESAVKRAENNISIIQAKVIRDQSSGQ